MTTVNGVMVIVRTVNLELDEGSKGEPRLIC
jgi:hypothetical protein